MKYEVVFLDADGTIWDFKRSAKKAFQSVIRQFGYTGDLNLLFARYHEINEALWRRLEDGTIKKDQLRVERYQTLFQEFDLDYSVEEVSRKYLKAIGNGKDLMDGAEEVCRYLSEKYRLVIVTNGMQETQTSRMADSVLEPFIDKMIISDEIGMAKPDPGIFEFAMNAIGHLNKETVIMVGDSLRADIAGGNAYGIDTCWVNYTGGRNTSDVQAKYEIQDIRELKHIL